MVRCNPFVVKWLICLSGKLNIVLKYIALNLLNVAHMRTIQLTCREYYNFVGIIRNNFSFTYKVRGGYIIITADVCLLDSLGF